MGAYFGLHRIQANTVAYHRRSRVKSSLGAAGEGWEGVHFLGVRRNTGN